MLSSNAASHQPLPVEQVTQVTEGVVCGAVGVVLLHVTICQMLVAGKSTDENENLLLGAKGKGYGTFHEEAVRVFSSLLEQESIADPIPVIQVK